MATISQQQAIERVSRAVREAQPDDLVEIYNEVFPDEPTTEDEAVANSATLVNRITAHIDQGLEVEEILDLWNVIYPTYRRVWFDEDSGLIHYDERVEPVDQPD